MYGKVVQLTEEKIIYGIDGLNYDNPHKEYDFGCVTFNDLSFDATKNYCFYRGFSFLGNSTGYIKFTIYNEDSKADVKQDSLIVIVSVSKEKVIETDGRMITGTGNQAFIVLNAGSIIEVKNHNVKYRYKAIQADNELLLKLVEKWTVY